MLRRLVLPLVATLSAQAAGYLIVATIANSLLGIPAYSTTGPKVVELIGILLGLHVIIAVITALLVLLIKTIRELRALSRERDSFAPLS